MNLNQLANAMKPAFLPGEEMRVKVIQQGKEPGQGVAFLDDGTMIVVEGGGSLPAARARCDRHPRAPDGRRADGLRPAHPGRPASRRSDSARTARRGRATLPVAAGHHSDMSATSGAFADAVIVAAGSSSRMGGTDKLEATLGGRSLLRWAVETRGRGALGRVGHRGRRAVAGGRARRSGLAAGPRRTGGGGRRAAAGLGGGRACVPRPPRWCWSTTAPGHSCRRRWSTRWPQSAATNGAAIPVLPVVDSLKRVSGPPSTGWSRAWPTGGLFRAQTPQGARRDLLLAAVDAFADGTRDLRRRGRAAGAPRRRRQPVAGEAGQSQGDRAR